MNKKFIKLSVKVEKEAWDKMYQKYGEEVYAQNEKDEFVLKEPIYNEKELIEHGITKNRRKKGLVSGELYVDLLGRIVYVKDKPIHLLPSDFQVLIELLEKAQKVVLRETLMAALESRHQQIIQDNAVSVHIRRLRRDLGSAHCIRTIHLSGYMWTREVKALWEDEI